MTTPLDFTPQYLATPSGARLRYAIFSAPPASTSRGVCLLLHGQTEFIEKYVEVIGELQARGFSVATFDWRGQGGSSRALEDTRKAHVGDFREFDEDLRTFLDRVVAPFNPEPPIALAHSMGAHILLRLLHERPQAMRAAVLTAPMLAISTRGTPGIVATLATAVMNSIGRSDGWVLGMEARDPLEMRFADNLVTSDRARWARTQAIVEANPDLRLAGPTWGWLKAAYASMREVTAPGYPEAIATPLLAVGAGRDRIVLTAATRAFVKRMPHATYVELPEAEHEILMESDFIRARFWEAFDAFAANNGV